jgi:hypothetical protein
MCYKFEPIETTSCQALHVAQTNIEKKHPRYIFFKLLFDCYCFFSKLLIVSMSLFFKLLKNVNVFPNNNNFLLKNIKKI